MREAPCLSDPLTLELPEAIPAEWPDAEALAALARLLRAERKRRLEQAAKSTAVKGGRQ